MAVYTWDAIYDRLKVDQGGLPGKSTQDMLDTFWTLAGYPDGTLGADAKVAFYESQGAVGDSLGDLEYDYWYRIGPNLLAAKGAVFAIDAAQSVANEQWALNRGSGGQVLRAKYGSVARAEVRNGVGLVLPGTTANYASVPDAAALDVTGNIEVVARVSCDNFSSATSKQIMAKKQNNVSEYSWSLEYYATQLYFIWTSGGTSATQSFTYATVAGVLPLGGMVWVKATMAGGVGALSWAPDSPDEPTSWTSLSVLQSGSGATIYSGSSPVLFGDYGSLGVPLPGVIARGIVRSGIGGTTVVDVDFAAQTDLATSFTAQHGYGIKDGALRLPGASGSYASVPDSAAIQPAGDFEVVERLAIDDWTKNAYQAFFNKQQAVSLNVEALTGKLQMNMTPDGSTYLTVTSSAWSPVAGTTYWVKIRRTKTSGLVEFFYAADQVAEPSSWTSMGSGTMFANQDPYDSTFTADWGAVNAGTAYVAAGAIKRSILRVASATVLDVDFTSQPDDTQSFTCSTGQVVTVNGCALPTVTVTAANAVDTNDPLWLPWNGENYIYFPSAIGNCYRTGHGSVLASLATLEFRVKVRFDTLGVFQPIMGTDSTHFALVMAATNQMQVYAINTPGLALIGNTASGFIPGLTTGVDVWLRAKVTIATAQCDYWYSYDATDVVGNVTWIALTGGVGTNAGTTPLLTGSAVTTYGAHSTGIAGMNGRMYVGSMLCDGAVRSHVDFTQRTPTTVDGNNLNGVTAFGVASSGRKTSFVTRPIWLFGTDDYLEVADNDLLDFDADDPLTVVAIVRQFGSPSYHALVSKKAGGGALVGWWLVADQGGAGRRYIEVADGTSNIAPITSGVAFGGLDVVWGRRLSDGTTGSGEGATASTTAAGAFDLRSSNAMRIGTSSSGTNPADMELLAVGIFRRALSATEIAQIVTWYGAS